MSNYDNFFIVRNSWLRSESSDDRIVSCKLATRLTNGWQDVKGVVFMIPQAYDAHSSLSGCSSHGVIGSSVPSGQEGSANL